MPLTRGVSANADVSAAEMPLFALDMGEIPSFASHLAHQKLANKLPSSHLESRSTHNEHMKRHTVSILHKWM